MARVSTHIMFQGDAAAAIDLYKSVFSDFVVERTETNEAGGVRPAMLAYVRFADQDLIVFDSPIDHAFDFTPSMSLFIECGSRGELEDAFGRLSEGGEILMPIGDYGFSEAFGWAKDRFGMSWQLNFAGA